MRERADLTSAELDELVERLDRLDRASRTGPWTRQTLQLLAANPRVRAQNLAESVGRDKPSFKRDVSKLKALGLTISHSPGYELSPRGRRLLTHLRETDRTTTPKSPDRVGRSRCRNPADAGETGDRV